MVNYKSYWFSNSFMVRLTKDGKPSNGSMVTDFLLLEEIKQKYLADRNPQSYQVFVVIKLNKYFPENI